MRQLWLTLLDSSILAGCYSWARVKQLLLRATRDKNLADALESFIGAVYLASGLETAKSCVYKLFEPYVREQRIVAGSYDFKSRLQEHVLKIHRVRPDYQLFRNPWSRAQ